MIKLQSNKNLISTSVDKTQVLIAKVTRNQKLPLQARSNHVLRVDHLQDVAWDKESWPLILCNDASGCGPQANHIVLDPELQYLEEHDVIRFNGHDSSVRALYRHSSPMNAFLLTERCNSFCLMCSQPPRDIDDHYHVSDMRRAIPLIHKDAKEIMITGGEPTLWGDDFVGVLEACRNHLPRTSVHVLSNGRTLSKESLAEQVASVRHPDLMFGIPIYADNAEIHDFVVQAKGAFDEAIRGIINLKQHSVPVEIRVVLHKQNVQRLPKLAEFIARNLLFVDHVALMGFEITGFTRANLEALWIDPFDYQEVLVEAMSIFKRYRMNASIYNHQLCTLPFNVHEYARKSISDWKNWYLPECAQCTLRSQCGGFFASAKHRHSMHIRPYR